MMADIYTRHSDFLLLTNDRGRWFNGRTLFIITVISLPIVIFCGIYGIILKSSESVLYPKSYVEVPPLWTSRTKLYSTLPQNYTSQEIHHVSSAKLGEVGNFKLVCYYDFPGDDPNALQPDDLDPNLCTHINVGFAGVSNNSLVLDEVQLEVLKEVVHLKDHNENLKVLVTVSGGDSDDGFAQMVRNHTNRKTFVKSVVECVKNYKIDGIDLDWEFPNRYPGPDPNQKIHFTQLLMEIRNVINKQTKHKFIVSVAAAAPALLIDQSYDVQYLNENVDFINVMTYDYHFYTKVTPFTGFNSPLYPSSEDKGFFATLNINYSVNYWVAKGMVREKIVIGLPTYGHSFWLTNSHNKGLYAPARGFGKLGSNGFVDYTQVCKFLTVNAIAPIFDSMSKSPYATKGTEWVSFDTEQSLVFKAEYIREQQFGGAMVYSLNADDHAGACKIDPNVRNRPFPLTRKIQEILDQNYSIS